MTTRCGVTVLLGAMVFAAGAAHAQAPAGTGPTLAFTVTDSAIRGPATFPAGVVAIQLANRGRGVHMLQLLTIGSGHTAEEAKAFILANDAPPPWTALSTGVGPVEGGQSIVATLKLNAGTYLLLDLLHDARGTPNYRNGLMVPIVGSGTARRDLANIPAVAGLMITNRFRFGNLFRSGNTWTQSESRDRNTRVPKGLQTLRIESYVAGAHSIVLARGGPEVMRQYVDWREGRRSTPPAGLVGGVPAVAFQARAFLQARLAPGGYILFCAERDPTTHMLGYETGEFTQFSVQ